MAYALNSSYEVPTNISWVRDFGNQQYEVVNATDTAEVIPTSQTFRFACRSVHSNFQMQYCIRRRKAPWKAAQDAGTVSYVDDETGETVTTNTWDGEDVWVPWAGNLGGGHAATGTEIQTDEDGNEWGPWQGNALSSSSPVPSKVWRETKLGINGWRVFESSNHPFSYDLANGSTAAGPYDRNEYRVRVRAFNATQSGDYKWNYGEWGEAVVAVTFVPIVTEMKAEQQDDGSYKVYVETNWQHGNFDLKAVGAVGADGNVIEPPLVIEEHATSESTDANAGDFTFSVPEEYVDGDTGEVKFVDMTLLTDETSYAYTCTFDDFGSYELGQHYTFPIEDNVEPSDIADPVVSISADGTVTVTPASTGSPYVDYSKVVSRVYWKDEEGVTYLENVTMRKDGDNWIGKVDAPPLGVEIGVRATASNANGDWKSTRTSLTVPGSANAMFDWDGEHFEWRYNLEYGMNISRNVEFVQTDGRDKETSRHARSSSYSWNIKCSVINPASGHYAADAWRADVRKFARAHHDWWLRLPGGYKQRVAIEEIDTETQYATNNKFMDVTISFREVA